MAGNPECIKCGDYIFVGSVLCDIHAKELMKELEELQYKWASIINSLACIAINGDPSSNDIDFANDMIGMALPYLGLAEE